MTEKTMYLDSLSGPNLAKTRVSAEGVSVLFNTENHSRERAERVMAINEARLDSLAPNKGFHLARELEYAYQAVIEQKRPELKGLSLIPTDSEVPAGAMSYKITSEDMTGSARYHRGEGYTIPRAGVTRDEELRPVRHIITGFELDMFELQASNFAGTNIRAKFQRAARRAMDEFLNEKVWLGSDEDDVYGILTYPFVPKTSSSVTISDATAAEDILAELIRLAQLQFINSKEVFSPDTLALPTRQYEYIKSTQINTAGPTQTILEAFLRDNGHVNEVQSIPFLRSQGAGGTDVALFFKRNDAMAAANVIPTQFTMLPAETNGFSIFVPCYMSHGGVRMWYPLNNLVAYTPHV